ncbi:MAG: hypothetical protein IJK68_01280 [Muribaculaceae bacterium]|nr:hypothetical protein [Muribaculaceae bacterium]
MKTLKLNHLKIISILLLLISPIYTAYAATGDKYTTTANIMSWNGGTVMTNVDLQFVAGSYYVSSGGIVITAKPYPGTNYGMAWMFDKTNNSQLQFESDFGTGEFFANMFWEYNGVWHQLVLDRSEDILYQATSRDNINWEPDGYYIKLTHYQVGEIVEWLASNRKYFYKVNPQAR